jgi:hypothetical protein
MSSSSSTASLGVLMMIGVSVVVVMVLPCFVGDYCYKVAAVLKG